MSTTKVGFRKYIIENNFKLEDNGKLNKILGDNFPKIKFLIIGCENGK